MEERGQRVAGGQSVRSFEVGYTLARQRTAVEKSGSLSISDHKPYTSLTWAENTCLCPPACLQLCASAW
ncbi:hypothetical protein O3P69_014770 [Scylla paramamosain]|uniref:Uncharacterized protein n=1 Tax=Scylla paramamosain TaxID=85552 RepID=A0AAW0U0Z3_SCYPA